MSKLKTPLRRIASGASLLAVLSTIAIAPASRAAICMVELTGTWQQTHVLIQGNRIPDDTQSWVFKPNGTMRFTKSKPVIDVSGNYRCEGDMIFMSGRMSNQYKIVDHGLDTMTWQSGMGGTLFVKRAAK